ncbi:MAG: DUF5309 family protein [Planctomycetota bacterium]
MTFTGKTTFGAGATLPELAEDVSDIIGIVSPFETPLLDHLGDARRSATSTIHEWIEDALLPNFGFVNQSAFGPSPSTDTTVDVTNYEYFRPGDLVRPDGSGEVMFVESINESLGRLTLVRGYGGTTAEDLADEQRLTIIGNAALEGDTAPEVRFTTRTRKQNYTQIFTSSVSVSGTMQAARSYGIADEVDYQKQERMRELLRDLENTVINGVAPAADAQGSGTVRRSMNGLLKMISTNNFVPSVGGFPSGSGEGMSLDETILNEALKRVWDASGGSVDTIVVNGTQKRAINELIGTDRRYGPDDETIRNLVSTYESDFGVCRVVLSRWVPSDTVLLLDSSRVSVLPLTGRSFHFKPLAATGDSFEGQIIGEYTLELMNESAHGVIGGLATA